jgi:hypothetical protein
MSSITTILAGALFLPQLVSGQLIGSDNKLCPSPDSNLLMSADTTSAGTVLVSNSCLLTLPDAPPVSSPSAKSFEEEKSVIATGLKPSPFVIEPNTQPPWHTLDRKFVLLQTFNAGAFAADMGTTVAALRNSKAIEINPLFGQHPSTARVIGEGTAIHILLVAYDFRIKKISPRRNVWKTAARFSIMGHTAATFSNLIQMRLSSGTQSPRSAYAK